MRMNSRHYTLILFALCSIVAASLGYVLVYRQVVIRAENSASVALEASNENLKKQHEQDLVGMHSATTDERIKLASFFVPEDSPVEFLEKIEKIGTDSQTDLEISSITTDEAGIRAKVELQGTWSGIMNSLMLLENMQLGISLNDIRLDTSGDLASQDKKLTKVHVWRLTMNIEALTRKILEKNNE